MQHVMEDDMNECFKHYCALMNQRHCAAQARSCKMSQMRFAQAHAHNDMQMTPEVVPPAD